MFEHLLPVLLLIILGLSFDFLNGFRDSANIVAPVISSQALSARQAMTIVALAEMAGPFLFGVAVATTIGSAIVAVPVLKLSIALAALVAALVWNVITWLAGIPSSSSHALIGGLLGAAVTEDGWHVVNIAGLDKVLLALGISPLLGLMIGYVAMKLVLFLVRGATPKINGFFRHSQILTALALALSYGANDGQKTMGIVTLGLVSAGILPAFHVPWWVIALSVSAIGLGTITGNWRLIRTVGRKFYNIRPVHGFTTEVASASVILGAAALGGPVSSAQVINSAIMGVGSAERVSKVHWTVARQIIGAWLITIPFAALVAAGVAPILMRWF